jgi:class 3 adenylate cyclase/predicted ATPase
MMFAELLDQALALLQRHGRVTYQTLRLQFQLDEARLAALRDQLLYAYPQVIDDAGRGLVWTAEWRAPDPERRFHALLPAVIALLRHEGRVTYRTLKYVSVLDDTSLEEVREELLLKRLAIEEDGKVLRWTSEAQSLAHPAAPIAMLPPTSEAMTAGTQRDEPVDAPEPTSSALEAGRRQLTVMFCDLADSTTLAHQIDPEDLREVVRAYQTTAADIIHHCEGHIAQYLGDGLLIYFGWPVAHEDDARRAAHAGLGTVEAITETLNPRLGHEKGVQLTMRLGVHTGPVVVGAMGGGGRHENLATGETVNIAARLEGLAAPNTVVINQATARLVQEAFALEALGPQTLKGVVESMPVFRVVGRRDADHDDAAVRPDGTVFLVGRDEESGLLFRRWEQSKEGLGQAVLLSGEAGIGKSSLLGVLRAQVRQEGSPRITVRCSSLHRHSALYPVIRHMERLLGLQREDAPAVKLDKLEQGLRSSRLAMDEVVPLFAALLSVPLDDRYPAPTLSPQQQKHQTLDALVAWMLEEAEHQPVLVAWEDLHWADPSTLELLGLILEQTPTVPMLHVLTFRPEFAPPWPTRSHMTPIMLNRLERPHVEALIRHVASAKPLPEEVIEHIVAKTDGVPLYIEELTKMLLSSGLLREDRDAYVLTEPLVTVAIPDTLQDSLMARLDQHRMAKEVAQLGAVLGREFAYEMLQALSPLDDATLQAALARLVLTELLYQRGRPPRARYSFKHALIQDAAYASLLRSTRQHFHQQIAELFTARFPETAEAQPELVAHHYTEAGLSEPAVTYWYQAGQQAVERSAYVEAIAHLTTGLAVLQHLPETPARRRQEVGMLTALGSAFIAHKGPGALDVEHTYTRALALCHQSDETPEALPVLWGLFHFYTLRAAHQKVYALAQQLLTVAQRRQDATGLLLAHFALGGSLYIQGHFAAARDHLEQGVAVYDAEHHATMAFRYYHEPGVNCLRYLALTLWCLGYADHAMHTLHTALTLAQRSAHPFSVAGASGVATWLYQFRQEAGRAHEHAEAVMQLAQERHFAHYVALNTIMQGWVRAKHGEAEEGIILMQQGLAACQDTGSALYRPYHLALLAEVYGDAGHPAAGLQVLDEALTIAHQHDERHFASELHRLRGELLVAVSGDHRAEAEGCFRQALALARQQHARSFALRAATSLARLWQKQGKRSEAHALLAPVYGWFTEGFDTADLSDAKKLLEELS